MKKIDNEPKFQMKLADESNIVKEWIMHGSKVSGSHGREQTVVPIEKND